MAIEIVDFPINSMVIFHCYVSSPEGIPMILQKPNPSLEFSIAIGFTQVLSRNALAGSCSPSQNGSEGGSEGREETKDLGNSNNHQPLTIINNH